MKNFKRIIIFVLGIGLLLGVSGCSFITKTSSGEKNTIVAKVNSEKIRKGDFQKRYDQQVVQLEAQYGKDVVTSNAQQIKENILDNMVKENLIIQKAKDYNISVDDKSITDEVNKQVQSTIKAMGNEDAFKKRLAELKMTEDDYKQLVRNNTIIDKVYQNVTKDVKVTDQEITNYYYEHQYDYTEKPNTLNVSHILVKTVDDAKKVEAELKKGAKFEELAKKYSIDPGSKDKGGNLGNIAYNDENYDKTFLSNAIALPVNKISAPVQTQFGYHIIRVNSKKEYKAIPLEKVKADISSKILEDKKSKKFQDAITSWEGKAKIKKYADRL